MSKLSLAIRIRAALRYLRAISREPVGKHEVERRKQAVNAELRRYVTEQQLVRAVREAVGR